MAFEIQFSPPLDFRQFAPPCAGQERGIGAGGLPHVLVDHGLWVVAIDNRSHGQFRGAGCTNFANQHEIERRFQGACDFQAHGHAAARQGIDHGACQVHRRKPGRQQTAGIGSVGKPGGHFIPQRLCPLVTSAVWAHYL